MCLSLVLCLLSLLCICMTHVFLLLDASHNLMLEPYVLPRSFRTATMLPQGVTVPRVMFQTWKNHDLLPTHRQCQDSWRPFLTRYGWTHRMFTDADIEQFVADRFAWYLPVWRAITPFIKKVDTFRYMMLYDQGGLYVDMDIAAKQPQELFELLGQSRGRQCFIPMQDSRRRWAVHTDAASPALIASVARHPFWLHMLEYIVDSHTHPTVIAATGPIALANVLRNYREGDIISLSEGKCGIGMFKQSTVRPWAYHINTTTWGGGQGKKEHRVIPTLSATDRIVVLETLTELRAQSHAIDPPSNPPNKQ
jgi:mannosyltransferase OCH1-like enzyme